MGGFVLKDKDESYVNAVMETAKSLWGDEAVSKMKTHIEQTAQAVQRVSSQPLTPEIEPVIKLRVGAK
jgi:hypothetical protein